MNSIVSYFISQLNNSIFEKKNILVRIQTIDSEISELSNHEKRISSREDSAEYVFNVDCFEKAMDERTLGDISIRRDELLDEKLDLEKRIVDCNILIEKYQKLYEESQALCNSHGIGEQLEFIMKLIDSDPQRAKLEIANLIEEEKRYAN